MKELTATIKVVKEADNDSMQRETAFALLCMCRNKYATSSIDADLPEKTFGQVMEVHTAGQENRQLTFSNFRNTFAD